MYQNPKYSSYQKSAVNEKLGLCRKLSVFLFGYGFIGIDIDISPTTVKTSAKARLKTALPVFDCGLNKPCLCAAQ